MCSTRAGSGKLSLCLGDRQRERERERERETYRETGKREVERLRGKSQIETDTQVENLVSTMALGLTYKNYISL
jgi:hypothetical protein